MNYLEITGCVTGIICVYLNIKQNVLGWVFGIASVICYTFVFYSSKLYGDAALQIFFLFFSIKGLFLWMRKDKDGHALAPSHCTKKEWLYIFISVAFFSGFLVGFLDKYTDSDVPFLDAITTIISIVAQILLGKKRIENWFLWIIVNVIYVVLYLQKSLHLTALLYVIFLIMAIFGFIEWRKNMSSDKYIKVE